MKIILLTLLLLITSLSFGLDSTKVTGDFETNTTWQNEVVPNIEDTLIVLKGHTLTISSNLKYKENSLILIVYGTLYMSGKLTLEANSQVILKGGTLQPSPGNGNNDKLTINGNQVWSGHDGIFKGDYVFSEGGVLPVLWGKITARSEHSIIYLDWSTFSELHNYVFEIEISSDLTYWNNATSVFGSGTTLNITNYNTKFFTNGTGVVYIRIKQIDYNGDYEYSEIIYVSVIELVPADIEYYIDSAGNIQQTQPHGFGIIVYKNGEKKKVILK